MIGTNGDRNYVEFQNLSNSRACYCIHSHSSISDPVDASLLELSCKQTCRTRQQGNKPVKYSQIATYAQHIYVYINHSDCQIKNVTFLYPMKVR